jgi:hypothetical protein
MTQITKDNTYGYAKSLAESLFEKHYAHEEHYASGSVVWEVSDTTIGVLTQIDNMVCTLVRQDDRPEMSLTFDEWYSNAIWGNEDFKEGCRRAWNASRGKE